MTILSTLDALRNKKPKGASATSVHETSTVYLHGEFSEKPDGRRVAENFRGEPI
jgi:hypothetical protein